MNFRLLSLVALLAFAALASGCQMSALPKACFQEEGCEHHPINR